MQFIPFWGRHNSETAASKEEGEFKTKMITGLGLDYLGGFDDAPRY